MKTHIEQTIKRVTGFASRRMTPLRGGCIGDVYRVELANGEAIVAKTGTWGLKLEGKMLAYLGRRSDLPVPAVLYSDDGLLLISLIAASGSLDGPGQAAAADLVAALHEITADRFGFDYDTVIGGLRQPNPPADKWLPFFAEQRLMYMARQAMVAGRLPGPLMRRLEKFSLRLDRWLIEPERPSLIHGDMWGGNVLAHNGHISGFIDPAIYYADAEIELAFITMFSTFSAAFFDRYREHRPLKPGFFEQRRDIYNLYPLLVHARLFGGHYVGSVDRTLVKFGF